MFQLFADHLWQSPLYAGAAALLTLMLIWPRGISARLSDEPSTNASAHATKRCSRRAAPRPSTPKAQDV
jgi:hypothetical protein